MELYNKEKKKAEVSMRKKGWKDDEDSVWKNLWKYRKQIRESERTWMR